MNSDLQALRALRQSLPPGPRMPALFVGHGSPLNAITDNPFKVRWQALGNTLPHPAAIVVVSAHWLTRGTYVTAMERPRTIHDFGGFPRELFEQQYPAPGAPELAALTQETLHSAGVQLDHAWGLDHGSWSVLLPMYPLANIPVLQLSIDATRPVEWHYEVGKELAALRERGVLIVGSGNLVHNLRALNWANPAAPPFDWAVEFDARLTTLIEAGDDRTTTTFQHWGALAQQAHPTYEHLLPLYYVLGTRHSTDHLTWFNDTFDMASVSMRSFVLS